MSEAVKLTLREQLDQYIGTWKSVLEEVDRVYPESDRSRELNQIVHGLGVLLNAQGYVGAHNFDPRSQKLSNRLFQPHEFTHTPEKKFLNDCFDRDNKEHAAKLLRLVYMVEFELSSLHYACLARSWLDETTSHWFSPQFNTDLVVDMKSLSEKLISLQDARSATEKIFFTHWQYQRCRKNRLNQGQLMRSLQADLQKCLSAIASEANDEKEICDLKQAAMSVIRQQQEGYNDVLRSSDKVKLIETDTTPSWFNFHQFTLLSPDTSASSRLSRKDVAQFQSGSDYDQVKEHIEKTCGLSTSFYSRILNVTDKFIARENQRTSITKALDSWGKQAELLVGQMVDDASAKRSLVGHYYSSMYSELEKSSTSQRSICQALEEFTVARVGMLVDGNWNTGDDSSQLQHSKECLKRENIGKFSRNIAAYKANTKNTRIWLSRVNTMLVFLGLSGVIYFGVRLAAMVLPENMALSMPVLKVAGMASLPSGILFAAASAIGILLLINWRYRAQIKEAFDDQMTEYHAHHLQPNTTLEKNVRQDTYGMLYRGAHFLTGGLVELPVDKKEEGTSDQIASKPKFVIEDENSDEEVEVDLVNIYGLKRSDSFISVDLEAAVTDDLERENERRESSVVRQLRL